MEPGSIQNLHVKLVPETVVDFMGKGSRQMKYMPLTPQQMAILRLLPGTFSDNRPEPLKGWEL